MTELSQVSFSVYMSPVGELLLTCERGMLTSLNMALQQGSRTEPEAAVAAG